MKSASEVQKKAVSAVNYRAKKTIQRALTFRPISEPLELRRLLTITGVVFNDTNSNGLQDAGESGVANCVVYADTNGDFVLDNSETSTTTSSNGSFSFYPFYAGDLRVVLPANTHATGTVTYVQPAVSATVNVGVAPGIIVGGEVFNDANGSGSLGNNDFGLAGRTVYEDLNNNGIFDAGEPSTVSGATGGYYHSADGQFAIGRPAGLDRYFLRSTPIGYQWNPGGVPRSISKYDRQRHRVRRC